MGSSIQFKPAKLRQPSQKTRPDIGIRCQTCFIEYGSPQALRNHIGYYQRKVSTLMQQLIEAQMHLADVSSEYSRDGAVEVSGLGDHTTGICDNTNNHDNEEDSTDDEAMGKNSSSCPHHECSHKKPYSNRSDLLRHFPHHYRCLELCRYCRQVFTQADVFLKHKCSSQTSDSAAFAMEERRYQMRRRARALCDGLSAKQQRLRKRRVEDLDEQPATSVSKRQCVQKAPERPEDIHLPLALSSPGNLEGAMQIQDMELSLSRLYHNYGSYAPMCYQKYATIPPWHTPDFPIDPSHELAGQDASEMWDHCNATGT